MSDIKMERVSALWEDSREEAEQALEQGLRRLAPLDGAYNAMQKEPFIIGDGFRGLKPDAFWASILRGGEIHLASDEKGSVAIHLIQYINHGLWAIWEAFSPPKRRRSLQVDKSAELVISYCFSPEGLGLKKIKALSHPSLHDNNALLKRLGFVERGTLPNEALFNGESHTMILWELDNPFLRVDQISPEAVREVSDDWDDAGDDAGNDSNGHVESNANADDASGDSIDGYEPVLDPWDLLVGVTDSQRSMASTANREPANAGRSSGGATAPRRAKNYW